MQDCCHNKDCEGFDSCEECWQDFQERRQAMLEQNTNLEAFHLMNKDELSNQLVLEVDGLLPCKAYIALTSPQCTVFISRPDAIEAVRKWLDEPYRKE